MKGKTVKTILSTFLLVGVIALTGCVSHSGSSGYVNEGVLVFDRPEKLTQSEQSRLVADIVGRMLTDPTFSDRYAEKMKEKTGGKLPIVVPTVWQWVSSHGS